MEKQNFKWLLIGVFLTLLIMSIGVFTYLFSDFLVKYSGITTYYSVLLIIILFILKEYIEFNRENKEDINILREVYRINEQILDSLKYFSETLRKGSLPVHSMPLFDVGIPIAIKRIDTTRLFKLIYFANDKIETLNERREELLQIIINPQLENKNKRRQAIENYLKQIGSTIDDAIKDLDDTIENIKRNLKKWKIY